MHERDTHHAVVDIHLGRECVDERVRVEVPVPNSDLRESGKRTSASVLSLRVRAGTHVPLRVECTHDVRAANRSLPDDDEAHRRHARQPRVLLADNAHPARGLALQERKQRRKQLLLMLRNRSPRRLERALGRERAQVRRHTRAGVHELVPGAARLELVRLGVDLEEVVSER